MCAKLANSECQNAVYCTFCCVLASSGQLYFPHVKNSLDCLKAYIIYVVTCVLLISGSQVTALL